MGDAELSDGLKAREAREHSVFAPTSIAGQSGAQEMQSAVMQERLDRLVQAFRVRGRWWQSLTARCHVPAIQSRAELLRFTEADLDKEFSAANLSGPPVMVWDIIDRLRTTYCGKLGLQFMLSMISEPRIGCKRTQSQSQPHLADP